ncbi:MAG: hypothetical protein ACTHNW_18840 [Mucilaginibacter sp.]
MREYLQVSYYTLFGIIKLIELGDFVYGEWIVYDDNVPKYHVIAWPDEGASNALIDQLLKSRTETIQSILKKINKSQHRKLSLGNNPFFVFVTKSESIELNLDSLPYEWVKQII